LYFYINSTKIRVNQKGVVIMVEKSAIDWIALVLVIVGGLNWGLVGLFNFDLVAAIFGEMSTISRAVYSLVGLAAIYMIYFATKK
jgi:uncharacterized membrane protein YuzA (DUF378 family)